MSTKTYTVLADYTAPDGSDSHVLLDIELPQGAPLTLALAKWVETKLYGELTGYMVLTRAW